MGGNWETSQEASLCPKIYSQGCNVSNWINAIKSADSCLSVMWYFYYFLCNCFTSNKNTLNRKYSSRCYPLLLVRRITHSFSTSQGMHEGKKHWAQTGSWLLAAHSTYSTFHQLLLNFIASETHRSMWQVFNHSLPLLLKSFSFWFSIVKGETLPLDAHTEFLQLSKENNYGQGL